MIWKVIGTICSLSFFVTGFSVLGDPDCVTAEIGGGRVIGVTCRADTYGTWSGGAAAFIMLLIGTALLAVTFLREIRSVISPSSQIASRQLPMNSTTHTVRGSTSNGTTCKYCKQEVPENSQECPNCFPEKEYTSVFSNRICPYCKKKYSMNLKECPTCFPEPITRIAKPVKIPKKQSAPPPTSSEEAMLDAFQESKPSPSKDSNPQFKTCPMCAEDIKFAAKKCRYCQHLLDV